LKESTENGNYVNIDTLDYTFNQNQGAIKIPSCDFDAQTYHIKLLTIKSGGFNRLHAEQSHNESHLNRG
jgi:hypothetical protein